MRVHLKIYLSGPMTGLPQLNYPAFAEAASRLRAMGHEVYNPQEWEDSENFGKFNHVLAFDDYCRYIAREADVVVLLPGWEASPGATAESSLARAIRKPSRTLESFLSVPNGPELFEYLRFDPELHRADALPRYQTAATA